jgi:hypothetical protein
MFSSLGLSKLDLQKQTHCYFIVASADDDDKHLTCLFFFSA